MYACAFQVRMEGCVNIRACQCTSTYSRLFTPVSKPKWIEYNALCAINTLIDVGFS